MQALWKDWASCKRLLAEDPRKNKFSLAVLIHARKRSWYRSKLRARNDQKSCDRSTDDNKRKQTKPTNKTAKATHKHPNTKNSKNHTQKEKQSQQTSPGWAVWCQSKKVTMPKPGIPQPGSRRSHCEAVQV